MMGLDKLDLYYEAHVAGLDGECFSYSIYFDDVITDKKFEETHKAIDEFLKPYMAKKIYLGYIDVSKKDDKIFIYHDLGNVNPNYENIAINGILKALNNVTEIKSVIINENCECEF